MNFLEAAQRGAAALYEALPSAEGVAAVAATAQSTLSGVATAATDAAYRVTHPLVEGVDLQTATTPALQNLARLSEVSVETMLAVFNAFQKEFPNRLEVEATHLEKGYFCQPNHQDKTHLMFVPLSFKEVLQGEILYRHTVLYTYDPVAKRLEFYDSLGLTEIEYYDRKGFSGHLDHSHLLDAFPDKNPGIIEYNQVHQKGTLNYSNGIYVLNYMLRRLRRESAESIAENGLTDAQVRGEARLELYQLLLKHTGE